MTDPEADAAAVLVRRGELIESRHRVAYAVADATGALRYANGDPQRPVFPRSAIKPLQAIAMVESGAADRFEVDDRELALACASHSGEAVHVETVETWLARLGLDQSALECGAHAPNHRPSAERLAATGRVPSPVHNNCSGKHAGMLTLARHLDAPIGGYIDPAHPVQRRIAEVLAAMAGLERLSAPAIDGCGVPTFPLPLGAIATAMARLAEPDALSPGRAAACRRIRAAMSANPELVAGTGRTCSAILRAAPGLVVKTGAEGVYAAALPERGLGVVLKVEDGATRAAQVAVLALLRALGALDDAAWAALCDLAVPTLYNHAGRHVGRIETAPGWPDLEGMRDCPPG